jgi:hypothetical protein
MNIKDKLNSHISVHFIDTKLYIIKIVFNEYLIQHTCKLEKKYAPALDNYGQSCFVRSDFLKMKCVCKTQMMPPPDHQNPVDMHTSIMCINILQNIKAVAPKL